MSLELTDDEANAECIRLSKLPPRVAADSERSAGDGQSNTHRSNLKRDKPETGQTQQETRRRNDAGVSSSDYSINWCGTGINI